MGDCMAGTVHILHETLQSLSVRMLAGNYTRLWKNWGEKNICPGYNKLYYLCKGEYRFRINGQEYEGRPGQLFLLPYSSTQTYYALEGESAEKYWIHCTFSCASRDLLQIIDLPICIDVDDDQAVKAMFEDILCDTSTLHGAVAQKAAVLKLLAYYIQRAGDSGAELIRDDRYLTITRYIQEHLREKMTVEELAALVHLNPNYFIRYFRKMTGSAPMEYVMNTRISKAREYMHRTEPVPIKEIAESCGFQSVHYFTRVFKQYTGYTPSKYREIALSSVSAKENDHDI